MHRDEQLFLDDASSHMQAEQTELLAKVTRLIIPSRVQHGVWRILADACGDVDLPEAERSAVASGGDDLAEVRLQEGESRDNALRRFKRKVQTEDIIRK